MYKAKCIEKIRDKNNHIIEYKLINKDKNVTSVKSDELKKAIKSGQIEVVNLTLTSDNRLIDKKSDTSLKHINTSSKPNITAEVTFNKAKILGYTIKEFATACGNKCYIASSPDNTKHIFIIPDNVKYIYQRNITKDIYRHMSNIKGILKVVGGKGLTSTWAMFHGCKAKSINLKSFNTSQVEYMDSMFFNCDTKSLDLTSFDTHNVTYMNRMFNLCKAKFIDLTTFSTHRAQQFNGMVNFLDNCDATDIKSADPYINYLLQRRSQ